LHLHWPVGGSILTAATSGAKVLFDSLFPPKTTASQYAYIDNTSEDKADGYPQKIRLVFCSKLHGTTANLTSWHSDGSGDAAS
jgi:hypothetical protein